MQRLVTALKPGGRLVVEDFDPTFIDPRYPTSDASAAALFTNEEIAQVLMLLDDPDFAISSHVMFTAWGRQSEP